MLDPQIQIRRLFCSLAQRATGDALDAVVAAARIEGLAEYFVAHALRWHETLDEHAVAALLCTMPLETRVRFAAERTSGPEVVAGLFDVDDFDEELEYVLDELGDDDELGTIPEWLWVLFAELGNSDTLRRVVTHCPDAAAKVVGCLARFDRDTQLAQLGRCAPLLAAALELGRGTVYDAALDVAMTGRAGEVTTDIAVAQGHIDEWLLRRTVELCAAGEISLVNTAADHLGDVCGWRCVETISDHAGQLSELCATHGGLERLSILVEQCTIDADVDVPAGRRPFRELLSWATSAETCDHTRFVAYMQTLCADADEGGMSEYARHGYALWRFATNPAAGDDDLTAVAGASRFTYLCHAYQHGLVERGGLAPSTVAATASWHRMRLGELLEVCADRAEAAQLVVRAEGTEKVRALEVVCAAGLWDDSMVPHLGCTEALAAASSDPDDVLAAAGRAVLAEIVDIIAGEADRARLFLELFPTFPGRVGELRAAIDTTCS